MKVLSKSGGKSEGVSSVGVDEAIVVAGYNAIEGIEAWFRSKKSATTISKQQRGGAESDASEDGTSKARPTHTWLSP